MLLTFWILIALAVFIVGILIYYYNRFVLLGNRIENSLAQIDVQLKKRADLVPALVKVVKGYASHEKKIMDSVSKARADMVGAGNMASRIKKGDALQAMLGKLFAIAENYPQLKANENFLQLQQELSAIEERIAYSRQYYNDSILSYNNSVETFPGVMFAKLYSKKEMQMLQITAEERSVPKVQF